MRYRRGLDYRRARRAPRGGLSQSRQLLWPYRALFLTMDSGGSVAVRRTPRSRSGPGIKVELTRRSTGAQSRKLRHTFSTFLLSRGWCRWALTVAIVTSMYVSLRVLGYTRLVRQSIGGSGCVHEWVWTLWVWKGHIKPRTGDSYGLRHSFACLTPRYEREGVIDRRWWGLSIRRSGVVSFALQG